MSADLSIEQKEIFRILAIYFWKKSRNKLYKLHIKTNVTTYDFKSSYPTYLVKHPQN